MQSGEGRPTLGRPAGRADDRVVEIVRLAAPARSDTGPDCRGAGSRPVSERGVLP